MNDGATVIVVGWTPDEFGEAALHRGVEEARLRGGRVVVVNATRGDALVDDRFADEEQLARLTTELSTSGVEVDVRRSIGADVGDQVLAVADDVSADLVVIGLRRAGGEARRLTRRSRPTSARPACAHLRQGPSGPGLSPRDPATDEDHTASMEAEALPGGPSADELLHALGHAVIATDTSGAV